MNWLVVRQYRGAFGWALSFTVALSVGLFGLAAVAHSTAALIRQHECTAVTSQLCINLVVKFQGHANWSTGAFVEILLVIPAMLGILFGVSVVAREFDTGTIGLVWLQGVSRGNWFWRKTLASGVIVLVYGTIVAILSNTWGNFVYLRFFNPSPLLSKIFDISGFSIVGYSVLAFGIGVFAGSVTRRSGVGVAVGAAIFVSTRLAIENLLRPIVENKTFLVENAWPNYSVKNGLLVNEGLLPVGQIQPSAGHGYQFQNTISNQCQPTAQVPSATDLQKYATCLHVHGQHYVVEFVSNSQYWPTQAVEFGVCILIGLSAIAISPFVLKKSQR